MCTRVKAGWQTVCRDKTTFWMIDPYKIKKDRCFKKLINL